jgi:enediyne biosynthesis protein E7
VLRGHQIRKGDMLGICPLVTHRLPEAWPEPDRFDPERFMGEDKSEGNRNFTYFPFGAVKHMCIGIHLAMFEMQIVLAMFTRRAKLAVIRPEGVTMKSKITLQVAEGLPVKTELRR